jgi:hypothetical protein
MHIMRQNSRPRYFKLLTMTGGFVLYLQIRTPKPFPTVSADTLNYSQMNLVHMASEPILPDELQTSREGTVHSLAAGMHNPGSRFKLLVEGLPLVVRIILRREKAKLIIGISEGDDEHV